MTHSKKKTKNVNLDDEKSKTNEKSEKLMKKKWQKVTD